MKTAHTGNGFSRRGILVGAAALAAGRWMPAKADDSPYAITAVPGPFAYVGCYTPAGRGISVYGIDRATNNMTLSTVVGPVSSPSFINLHPNKKFLYAGCEVGPPGLVMAFAINSATGDLQFLSQQSIPGAPAHIIVHPGGKFVLTANYTGSTVSVLPINSDGSVGAASQNITHYGDLGSNSGRQEAPHPHMVSFDPTGNFVLVNDLGLDATVVYSIDLNSGKLTEVSRYITTAGTGPRHLAWHPNGKVVYSIKELNCAVDTFLWTGNGALGNIQSDVSALPKGYKGPLAGAEILVAPSGKFLYTSNRSHDSIGIFSIDPATSQIAVIAWTPTQGETPRAINFDPSGQFIHATNQGTGNIVSFSVDATSGLLTPTGQYIATGQPTCIQFAYS